MDLESDIARMRELVERQAALVRARSERNHRVRLAAAKGDWNELSRITAELIASSGGVGNGENPLPAGTGGVGVNPPGNAGG